MSDLTITNIDDALLEEITFQARVTHRSVEDVARDLIRLGLLMDGQGRAAVAEHIRAITPGPVTEDSTDIIRRMRDAV
ncbi:hypothetical protein [Methylobacterium oryzisoli]|uniref:hypothetical protein n=1 Tax=Methylobacterium oryzisoli TaxID=3385502 RepID=UPI00389211B9